MQQYPDIDQTLTDELVRLGYTEDKIEIILDALGQNANNAGYGSRDPRRTRFTNAALTALIQRFEDVLNNEQYDTLLNVGYMPSEIGDIFFTNLMTATQLLARTEAAQDSGEYNRLHKLGYTDIEIRSLIRAGFNVSQLRAVANRINAAQRNGADSQGLTIEQLNDMLFKKRSINGVQTLGVIQALLSGIHSKMCEGDVARCIIEYVTMFDVPYGPGGTHGQIDVGTRHIIVEVKVGSITGRRDTYKQIKRYISNDMINSPDTNGVRKSVILYAPGYNKAASANITGIGGYITKSCEQLREQIRQLGGP